MSNFPVETFPVFGFLEWYIIGYEECRRGHNYLIDHNWQHLLPDYHAVPGYLYQHSFWLPDRLKLPQHAGQHVAWPPNVWHWQGVADCSQRYQTSLDLIPDYRFDPDYRRYKVPTDCDWCGRRITQVFRCEDLLQDQDFCSLDHLQLHRRRLLAHPEMQWLEQLYLTYPFSPLHPDPLKVQTYVEKLPSHFSPDLVDNSKPVCLPIVQRAKPEPATSDQPLTCLTFD